MSFALEFELALVVEFECENWEFVVELMLKLIFDFVFEFVAKFSVLMRLCVARTSSKLGPLAILMRGNLRDLVFELPKKLKAFVLKFIIQKSFKYKMLRIVSPFKEKF